MSCPPVVSRPVSSDARLTSVSEGSTASAAARPGTPGILAEIDELIAQHGSVDNDLAEVSTWEQVSTKATDGSLEIEVETDNTYVLNGLADDIGDPVDVEIFHVPTLLRVTDNLRAGLTRGSC